MSEDEKNRTRGEIMRELDKAVEEEQLIRYRITDHALKLSRYQGRLTLTASRESSESCLDALETNVNATAIRDSLTDHIEVCTRIERLRSFLR